MLHMLTIVSLMVGGLLAVVFLMYPALVSLINFVDWSRDFWNAVFDRIASCGRRD